mgnify:FL=1
MAANLLFDSMLLRASATHAWSVIEKGAQNTFVQGVAHATTRCAAARRHAAAHRVVSAVRPLRLGKVVSSEHPFTINFWSVEGNGGIDVASEAPVTCKVVSACKPLMLGREIESLL